MTSRRTFLKLALAAPALTAAAGTPGAAKAAAQVGDNGLHVQPWFLDSFMYLQEDLASAAANSKNLAVLFEQRACPYCREMHQVNLANEKITNYVRKNFDILQLDMWGNRKVTDFDGKEYDEKDLARAWRVQFTPTIVFFPRAPEAVKGKSGFYAEVARMPGYFKPFHFISMFEYVHEGAYAEEPSFQRYLQAKFKRMEERGEKPDIW
jgi:thioredoxin-related protein